MNLNFDKKFVDKILSGAKIHTLRASNRWKNGDKIHFCVKNECFAQGCVKYVIDDFIRIENNAIYVRDLSRQCLYANFIGDSFYSYMGDINNFWRSLAKNDGFDSVEDFFTFFSKIKKDGLYQLIFWNIEGIK